MAPYFGQKSALLQELAVNAYSSSDYSSELTAFHPEFRKREEHKDHARLPEKAKPPNKKTSKEWMPAKDWWKYARMRLKNRQTRKGKAKGKGKD